MAGPEGDIECLALHAGRIGGTPDASTDVTVKPTDASVKKNTPGLPKAPQSNAGALSSGTTGPSSPVKGPADASRTFPLQFGSISPVVIKQMQVPGRTSSAPPNLVEQKQAQELHSLCSEINGSCGLQMKEQVVCECSDGRDQAYHHHL